ncbi:MAG: hypothetical protein IT479_03715 [Xanthomonadales bacterium]|nr:hypothetical protein [Xanthomonadales bacterium]
MIGLSPVDGRSDGSVDAGPRRRWSALSCACEAGCSGEATKTLANPPRKGGAHGISSFAGGQRKYLFLLKLMLRCRKRTGPCRCRCDA